MYIIATNFSQFLREFREKAELTQSEMAQKLNISQSHVSKYERGKKIIDLETFVNWVRITNSEAQAAIVMFGADIFSNASQMVSLIPAFIQIIDATQLFM